MTKKYRIATRGSELALWQTHRVQSLMTNFGLGSESVVLTTKGDLDQRPFQSLGGDGFFTKELERSMLINESDMAVHSAKDLPSLVHEDLPWFAFGHREESVDILIQKKGQTLTPEHVIGSSSPRRERQLQALFPGCKVVPHRGNVPTRIAKVKDGLVAATVLAKAGVKRLGLLDQLESQGLEWTELPGVGAPCQGIIGVQARRDCREALSELNNRELTEIAFAEKQVLAYLGGGCHLPLGAQFQTGDRGFQFRVYHHDGTHEFEGQYQEASLAKCLRKFMGSFVESKGTRRVWLTQPIQHTLKPSRLLANAGLATVPWPLLEVTPCWSAQEVRATLNHMQQFGAVSFSSQFGVQMFFNEFGSQMDVKSWLQARPVFAVGGATAKRLREYGVENVETGVSAHGRSLAERIQATKFRGKLLIPGQKTSLVTKHLRDIAGQVHPLVMYRVRPSQSCLTQDPPPVQKGDQIVLTSPSAAREYVLWCQRRPELRLLEAWAFGPSTNRELTFLGIQHKSNPTSGSWEKLVEQLKRL